MEALSNGNLDRLFDKGDFEGRRDIIDSRTRVSSSMRRLTELSHPPITNDTRVEIWRCCRTFETVAKGWSANPHNKGAASQRKWTPRSRASITSLVLMMPKSKMRTRPLPTCDATAFQVALLAPALKAALSFDAGKIKWTSKSSLV